MHEKFDPNNPHHQAQERAASADRRWFAKHRRVNTAWRFPYPDEGALFAEHETAHNGAAPTLMMVQRVADGRARCGFIGAAAPAVADPTIYVKDTTVDRALEAQAQGVARLERLNLPTPDELWTIEGPQMASWLLELLSMVRHAKPKPEKRVSPQQALDLFRMLISGGMPPGESLVVALEMVQGRPVALSIGAKPVDQMQPLH